MVIYMVYLLGVVYMPEVALTDESSFTEFIGQDEGKLFSPVAKKEASELLYRRPPY